jgi:hypothetical protein
MEWSPRRPPPTRVGQARPAVASARRISGVGFVFPRVTGRIGFVSVGYRDGLDLGYGLGSFGIGEGRWTGLGWFGNSVGEGIGFVSGHTPMT